jgi:beta-1,4-mannosyl-glycoprotein beta-1,4-N-acetylglucosaminyltransferase
MILRLTPRLSSLLTIIQHRWRRVVVVSLTLYCFHKVNTQKHPFTTHPHTISSFSLDYERDHLRDTSILHRDLLPLQDAEVLCQAHNWKPWRNRGRGEKRKVYDLFMLNDELDWLEIRLHTLAPFVDYFVISESPVTFTGLEKKLLLKANWDRFKEWHGQIIYKEVENMPVGAPRTWDLEDFQRNAMVVQGLGSVERDAYKGAREGDVLIVSDVDEIPRPISVVLLRECRTQKRVTVRSQFYYYAFQFRHKGMEWSHPQATVYAGTNTILPADLRNGEGKKIHFIGTWWEKADLWNGGWHCSTCFETIGEVLSKMSSFSHVGLNAEEFRDRTRIVDRVRKGLDLWDREGEVYEQVYGNDDIPEYLKSDRKRWEFLLDRSKSNAGFKDYGPDEDAGD